MVACTYEPNTYWKSYQGVPIGFQLRDENTWPTCTMAQGVLHHIDRFKGRIARGEVTSGQIQSALENIKDTHEMFSDRLAELRRSPDEVLKFAWCQITRTQDNLCDDHTADDLEGLLKKMSEEIPYFEKKANEGFPYGKAAIAVGLLLVVATIGQTYLNS